MKYLLSIFTLLILSCKSNSEFLTSTSKDLSGIDINNIELLDSLLNSFEGETIDKVYYAITNHPDDKFNYEGFHLCDQAVIIKTKNNKWLNWVWVEEGIYGEPDLILAIGDKRKKFTNDYWSTIIDVTYSDDWNSIQNKEIKKIEYNVLTEGDKNYLSDLRFNINNNFVTISAIAEPDTYLLPEINSLEYERNWTIIIFDDSILSKYGRILKSN